MATLAVFEGEIAAERSPAVVTGETRRAAGGDKVLGRRGRAYLTCLRRAGGQAVAIVAGEFLSCVVVRMTESVTI